MAAAGAAIGAWLGGLFDDDRLPDAGATLPGSTFSYRVDSNVVPLVAEIPGLGGGSPRPVAVAVAPDGTREEYVADEVIIETARIGDLQGFLDRYGGTVVRDGTARLAEGTEPAQDLPAATGWHLVRVDPQRAPLDRFAADMEGVGLGGSWSFSSDEAARLVAIVAAERERGVSTNPIADLAQCTVCEHPLGGGGNADAGSWWWLSEGDPALPDDQDVSVGVIRAWDYLRYQGFPPAGPYFPVRVAVVDGGFDLDDQGVPVFGGGDFLYPGAKPAQLDEVDGDWLAGGIASGFANCPEGCWHGHLAFGACCANARNQYGAAGTSGGGTTGAEIQTLLIRIGPDVWTIAAGVYDAAYNNAHVINVNVNFRCDWLCRTFDNGNVLKAYVGSARNHGSIVVAPAGNNGRDIDGVYMYPCALDGVICVGAVHQNAAAWGSSNWGSVVDIWAPSGIRAMVTRVSARDGPTADADDLDEDELDTFGGTSCASPYLAGIVALIKALDRGLYQPQVEAILQATANPSHDPKVVPGYVDAYHALVAVAPNQPPAVTITAPTAGEAIPTGSVALSVEVIDPEQSGPWGHSYENTVIFSSDFDGPLCTATGVGPTLGCTASSLSMGNHVIEAVATDAFGAAGTDTVVVEVANRPPTAVITFPTDGAVVAAGPVNLVGYGFDPDQEIPDGGLSWSSSLDGDLGAGRDLWVTLPPGSHTLTLTVTDDQGATGETSVAVTVEARLGHPTAQITSPAHNTLVAPGTPVTLEATATDPEDGALVGDSLQWYSDVDGFLGTGSPLTLILSGGSCDSVPHTVTVQAVDRDGNTAEHSIIVVVVEIC